MPVTRRKAGLSSAQRRLLELMQDLNFGRILHLHVRDGEPLLEPPPRVVCEIKLGGEYRVRRELEMADFALKARVVEFFDLLTTLGDGVIACLEVKHGLPFVIDIEGVPPR